MSQGFTNTGLYRISESIRAYAYLILISQANSRLCIIGNMANALTAQKAFLNNFENVVNRRVDIREDIKHYQDTLSYTLSKVDYSMGKSVYMLPSNMNLKIRPGTTRYDNKIFTPGSKLCLGTNDMINVAMSSPHIVHQALPQTEDNKLSPHTLHDEEKITLASAFGIWYTFR